MWVCRPEGGGAAGRRREGRVKPGLRPLIEGSFTKPPSLSLQMAALKGDTRCLRQWWLRNLIGWEKYNGGLYSLYRFNEVDYSGANLMFLTAARAGDVGLLEEFLLERGNAWEIQCKTLPWMVAVSLGHVGLLSVLAQFCEASGCRHLAQMLSEAVEEARCPSAQRLLGEWVGKLAPKPSLLLLQSFLGRPHGLKAILDSGMKITNSVFKQPVLFAAVTEGCLDSIALLLQYGSSINCRDKFNRTPLHKAVDMERMDIVQFLLKAGARLNVKDRRQLTPLDKARSPHMRDLLMSYQILQEQERAERARERAEARAAARAQGVAESRRGRRGRRRGRGRGRGTRGRSAPSPSPSTSTSTTVRTAFSGEAPARPGSSSSATSAPHPLASPPTPAENPSEMFDDGRDEGSWLLSHPNSDIGANSVITSSFVTVRNARTSQAVQRNGSSDGDSSANDNSPSGPRPSLEISATVTGNTVQYRLYSTPSSLLCQNTVTHLAAFLRTDPIEPTSNSAAGPSQRSQRNRGLVATRSATNDVVAALNRAVSSVFGSEAFRGSLPTASAVASGTEESAAATGGEDADSEGSDETPHNMKTGSSAQWGSSVPNLGGSTEEHNLNGTGNAELGIEEPSTSVGSVNKNDVASNTDNVSTIVDSLCVGKTAADCTDVAVSNNSSDFGNSVSNLVDFVGSGTSDNVSNTASNRGESSESHQSSNAGKTLSNPFDSSGSDKPGEVGNAILNVGDVLGPTKAIKFPNTRARSVSTAGFASVSAEFGPGAIARMSVPSYDPSGGFPELNNLWPAALDMSDGYPTSEPLPHPTARPSGSANASDPSDSASPSDLSVGAVTPVGVGPRSPPPADQPPAPSALLTIERAEQVPIMRLPVSRGARRRVPRGPPGEQQWRRRGPYNTRY